MKLEYFIAADSVVIDQLSNRVSIFHIADEIVAPTLPVVLPSLATVACFEVDPGAVSTSHRAVLRLAGSAVAEPHDLASEFTLLGARHRLTHRVENVVLVAEGRLELHLLVDDAVIARRAITVRRS